VKRAPVRRKGPRGNGGYSERGGACAEMADVCEWRAFMRGGLWWEVAGGKTIVPSFCHR